MYPPVGPAKTETPPLNIAKTGRPSAPKIIYKLTETNDIFNGKTIETIKITRSDNVKGIGGVGILI